MASVRVGLFPPVGQRTGGPEELQATLARAGDAGVDHLCVGDHVSFFVGAGSDGLITAASMLAGQAELPVYVGFYLLPLRHPVLVARQLATIAQLAPGRLTFGVGIGGEDRHEIETCDVDPKTHGRRMDECLQILRRLADGTPADVAEFLSPYIEAGCSAFNVIPCAGETRARLPRSASSGRCSQRRQCDDPGGRVEPLTDVRDISRIAYGFIASKALFAALELDLFSRLREPKTTNALARESGIPAHRVKTLLATLTALGLIVRDGDCFRNSPASERYLTPGSPAYFGEYYRLQINRQMYPALDHLDAGLAGDASNLVDTPSLMSDPAEAEVFSVAQHAASLGPAIMLAKTIDLHGSRTLLDVAGGSGAFSITLCRLYPELTATIIDFPNVIEIARRFIADAGLSERIELAGGNALDTDWPGNQEVVLMSYLLSAVKEDDIPTLLASAYRSLRPGGMLIVHDFMLDDDEQGPALAAQFFLLGLAFQPDAGSFSAATLSVLMAKQGFMSVSSQTLIPQITKIVVGTKPA